MKHSIAATIPIFALIAGPANALTVKCVATAQGLRNALTDTLDGDDLEIRMEMGVYSTAGMQFEISLNSDKELKLSGGWTSNLCESQQPDAALTVLHGGNTGYVVHLGMVNISSAPSAILSNFTIADGNGNFAPAGGMFANLDHGTPKLLLDRLRFIGNDNSGPGGALHIQNRSNGVVELRNSLVTGNSASNGGGVLVGSANANAVTLLVNNTITDNHATNQNSSAGGFAIDLTDPSAGLIELRNNAILGNTHGATVTPAEAYAYPTSAGFSSLNNAYAVAPSGQVTETGSLIGPAGFVGNSDFRLTQTSPLVDAGAVLSAEDAASLDLDLRARVVGVAVDIGAYEFDTHLFGNGFE